MYCKEKEQDLKIQELENKNNELINNIAEKDKMITEKELKIQELNIENSNLKNLSSDINEKYNDKEIENQELKNRISVLQNMLSATLKFCDNVKNSKFGKFFFRKQLKELPEPNNDQNER